MFYENKTSRDYSFKKPGQFGTLLIIGILSIFSLIVLKMKTKLKWNNQTYRASAELPYSSCPHLYSNFQETREAEVSPSRDLRKLTSSGLPLPAHVSNLCQGKIFELLQSRPKFQSKFINRCGLSNVFILCVKCMPWTPAT